MTEEELETPASATAAVAIQETANMCNIDDMDGSACSTPYVSAPSSPGRGQPLSGFYYSAPTSPVHYVLSISSNAGKLPFSSTSTTTAPSSLEDFDFSSATLTSGGCLTSSPGPMSSADELFFNGQIRPMKLSTHLQHPQVLAPLLIVDENDQEDSEQKDNDSSKMDLCPTTRGRDNYLRDKSLRRRTRSMSPLRSPAPFDWQEEDDFGADEIIGVQNEEEEANSNNNDEEKPEDVKTGETTPCDSGTSSRSSSVGRSSRRWVSLKDFLYRSKSEGRNNGHKFWSGLSFSPVKDTTKKFEKLEKLKIPRMKPSSNGSNAKEKSADFAAAAASEQVKKSVGNGKTVNGAMGKRRVPPSAHELHYTANRAQAEELRKKTFLPYRQGLLGCLGFSSKSYGAWNGFTRALNPVSSR